MSLVKQPNGNYVTTEPVWLDHTGAVVAADSPKRSRLLAERGTVVNAYEAELLGMVEPGAEAPVEVEVCLLYTSPSPRDS